MVLESVVVHCLRSHLTLRHTYSELIKRYEDKVERLKFELMESKVEGETILDKYNHAKDQLQVLHV